MPEIRITRSAAVDPATAWAFISEMDNWAPLLTGYESHVKTDKRHSRWTVKGELAGLTRIAEIDVAVTEWKASERIAFTLTGVNEPFAGGGEFTVAGIGAPVPASDDAPVRTDSVVKRIALAAMRWLLRLLTRRGGEHASDGPATPLARAGPAGRRTTLACRLEVSASGGSGPIMNLLLPAILDAVAQDTAGRIVAALEAR
ncbi:SRPBCC family protein [Croceicoccus mobilis]|uniref:SRPBCC family protein n=1 Tax=Croceicoccus mobilis TaxID=1703339 RepID=A0A916Z7L6_9SPHN|nr:SRPBCC family protein [Croceicoccus mobilis]GGD80371.1 hypothetical protein GCM10010990_32830 [Croceicoccus mobilis]